MGFALDAAAYRANTLSKMIHRNPVPAHCPSSRYSGAGTMPVGTVDVWMALRPPKTWTLCSSCFSEAQQAMLYLQAKDGRAVDVA